MYIITYVAVSNDTYESRQFVLQKCINSKAEQEELNSEDLEYEMMLETLPTQRTAKRWVKDTYDGVWEPDLKSVKVYKVEEV
jgi:hypothetical protein